MTSQRSIFTPATLARKRVLLPALTALTALVTLAVISLPRAQPLEAQELDTRVAGQIPEWRIASDGTILLRMQVTESKAPLKGDFWLRTPANRSDSTRLESLILSSLLLTECRDARHTCKFYALIEIESKQAGRSPEHAVPIRTLGHVRH